MTGDYGTRTWRAGSVSLWLAGAALGGTACGDGRTVEPSGDGSDAAQTALATSTVPPFDFVSTGLTHNCALSTDDRAFCWGLNAFAQLGDGTDTERALPVPVTGGRLFTRIDAGYYSTCAVTPASKAYCWGGNDFGQLGDGTMLRRYEPRAVRGEHLFRQVSMGSEHACGVTTDDRAFCWGLNTFGQLGTGTTAPDGIYALKPVAVTGTLRFREVSTGVYHTCGVTTDNRAYCWGGDQWGQIGDGSGSGTCGLVWAPQACRTKPTLVAGGYRFRQVDAGGDHGPGEGGGEENDGGHTCGVTTDNRALCWGAGRHGQNGDGTLNLRKAPVLVAGGLVFQSVSTGASHVCGVTTSSLPYCWGWNWAGQLGDGTVTQRNQPKLVSGGRLYRQLSAGSARTCGTTLGNLAFCWGAGGSRTPARVGG